MKQLIRKGVFETNSSSTHSIHIEMDKNFTPSWRATPDEVIEIEGGEFGWAVEDYYDFYSKAAYILSDNAGELSADDDILSLTNIMLLREVIMEVTGAKDVRFVPRKDKYCPWGYVDHQSWGTSEDACVDKETLKAFLFNQRSYVHTDNDNH